MIDKDSFHILNFIKMEEYSGSMDGMRYMIRKVPGESVPEGEDKNPDRILVTVWPEPLGIAATAEKLKTYEYFTLDEDGVSDVADWLNKQYFDRMDEWKAAKERLLCDAT